MENQNFNPVVWFEIYVDDMERASKFYETVLGIQLHDMSDPTDESMAMRGFPGEMNYGGASGALVRMKDIKACGGSTIVYFGCEDCAVEESRVAAAGGKVHQPKMSIGTYGFISLIVDTESNMIGLHSLK